MLKDDEREIQAEHNKFYYSGGKGQIPRYHPTQDHPMNIRLWEFRFNEYKNDRGEHPGKHPIEDHKYNEYPELIDFGKITKPDNAKKGK